MTEHADRGTLADRLRQMADDVTYLTTHSDACWQWHESCALHRAADALDRAERPSVCPECGSRGACGYDDLGRPMIHTTEGDDDATV